MKLYNTLTRQKEEFIPIQEGKVKMYSCGPTVYDFIHIGNARPITIFDTLRRYLEYRGYDVTFAQNFTDIDDKIINRAKAEGVTSKEIAEKYIAEYNIDVAGLGVRPPDIIPKATETVDEIIQLVSEIIEKGYGYEKEGDVYFRTKHFKDYGKLSRQSLDDLLDGARVAANEQKDDILDFALWKAAKPGEPSWDSPWGKGRPGWHIECSAMVRKHLGENIDIHSGGQDLVFPHHENEIAQSESVGNGKNFANYWVHNGYINVDNTKMSKSLGNFSTVREIANQYGYDPIKIMLLQAHYRSPMNYSAEVMKQSQHVVERIHNSREHLDFSLQNYDDENTEDTQDFLSLLKKREEQFITAMDDDLNTADGLTALLELTKDSNSYLQIGRPKADIEAAISLFDRLADVLGIRLPQANTQADAHIQEQIAKREEARKNKDFALADQIRDQLKAEGVELEDTPQGVKYHITKA